MRKGELTVVKMGIGIPGRREGPRQQRGSGQAAKELSGISEGCQVAGEKVHFGEQEERCGKRAQNLNPKDPDCWGSPRKCPGF